MKINKAARRFLITSSCMVLFGLLYFNFLLPLWNFLNNELENPNDIKPGTSFGAGIKIPTPNPSQDPSETDEPKPSIPNAERDVNILLLGADDAGGLTDTICIVNIDTNNKKIKLISIPRDAYIPYEDWVKERLAEEGLLHAKGIFKINMTAYLGRLVGYPHGKFENKGINFMSDIIESMLGYKIDEYMHINFDGFVEIVDLFGGVWVTAPENIHNNKGELVIKEGRNKMDGKKALFYVRARYRYDEFGNQLPSPGDSYRKANQLNMMVEVSKQLVTPENITKAQEILNTLRKNLHHSITVSDLSEYSKIALDYAMGKYTIETHVIRGIPFFPDDDPTVEYVNIL
jgi:LCP family protein required for cell wall assembly